MLKKFDKNLQQMDLVPTVPAVTVVQRRPQNDGFLTIPASDEAPSVGRSHRFDNGYSVQADM